MPIGVYDHYKIRGDKNPAKRIEVREKISKKLKGRTNYWIIGDKNPAKRPEVRKKVSETRKRLYKEGKLKIPFPKGCKREIPWITGENSPSKRPEVKEKIGKATIKALKGKPQPWHQGNKHPNWNNGSSFEPYTPEFNRQLKNSIRQRDEYRCQFPGCSIPENGKAHDVHHIDYDKMNCNPENLILLCCRHNLKVNFNREYWTQYFQRLYKRLNKREPECNF